MAKLATWALCGTVRSMTDSSVETAAQKTGSSLVRTTALISIITLVSRVLGLVREQLQAALLGTDLYGEAFQLAFRIPNLLRDLFAEGALSVAFQTVFAKRFQQEGSVSAYSLANVVFTGLLVVVGTLVVWGMVFAPWLVRWWAPGFDQGTSELALWLLRIMMPFLLLVSWSAMSMAMLNAQKRFVVPAFASVFFNLAALGVGIFIWIGHQKNLYWVTTLWAGGVLLGGLLQWIWQLPALWRKGYRVRLQWNFREPGLRAILKIMAPVTLGLAAVQINLYLTSSFASYEKRSMVWLGIAFRLIQVPIGLFGVAAGTVALSKYLERGHAQVQSIQESLRRSLRTVFWLTLPTVVGIWVWGNEVVWLLFRHGKFLSSDVPPTTRAFQLYSMGLVAYAAVKVIAPAFYVFERTFVPVWGTLLAAAVNVVVSVIGHRRYGYQALALAVGLGSWANLLLLGGWFHSSYGGLQEKKWWWALGKISLAAGGMGGVLWGWKILLHQWLPMQFQEQPLWLRVGIVGSVLLLGVSSYAGLCILLRLEDVWQLLRRRR